MTIHINHLNPGKFNMNKIDRIVPPITDETDIKEWSLKFGKNLKEVLTDMDETLTFVKGNSVKNARKLKDIKQTLDEHAERLNKIDEGLARLSN